MHIWLFHLIHQFLDWRKAVKLKYWNFLKRTNSPNGQSSKPIRKYNFISIVSHPLEWMKNYPSMSQMRQWTSARWKIIPHSSGNKTAGYKLQNSGVSPHVCLIARRYDRQKRLVFPRPGKWFFKGYLHHVSGSSRFLRVMINRESFNASKWSLVE